MQHRAGRDAVAIVGCLALAGWAGCTLDTAGSRLGPGQVSPTSSSAGSGNAGPTGTGGGMGGGEAMGGSGGATGGAGGAGGGALCGNGIAEGAEECDDGNGSNEDGCTDQCVVVCPPIWVKSASNHCYIRLTPPRSWDQARDVCNFGPSFHLATLTSMEEVELGGDLLPSFTATWLGGTDEGTEGTWTWITGEPWDWVNGDPPWYPGEPNDANGNEDCVLLLDDGRFNDDNCGTGHDPLCEYTPPGT